jgi:GT2 family glycosyltransferase
VLAVAISTYERPVELAACARALLAGTALPDEIIVVDQSDDAGTREAVAGLESELVRYVHHSPASVSGARNHAFELAASEYVAILDDDCEPPSDWLETAQGELSRRDLPDALFGEIRDPDPDPRGKAVPVSMLTAQAREWTLPANPWEIGFGGHSIIRRQVHRELGGFDPRLGYGGELLSAEDVDFNYRLLKGGYRVVSTPELWVYHRAPPRPPSLFYKRNFGFAAFCAKQIRAGDRSAWRMFGHQALSDAKMLASSVRRRSWLKARTWFWMTAGTWRGLVRGLRAYR